MTAFFPGLLCELACGLAALTSRPCLTYITRTVYWGFRLGSVPGFFRLKTTGR